MSARKLHLPVPDLEMLSAIDEGGMGAVEELADVYLRKNVVAKLKDLKRRGLVEWAASMWFPWLTDAGKQAKVEGRQQAIAEYTARAALEWDRAAYEAQVNNSGADAR